MEKDQKQFHYYRDHDERTPFPTGVISQGLPEELVNMATVKDVLIPVSEVKRVNYA